MDSDRLRPFIAAVVVALVAFGVAWFYASVLESNRIRVFRTAIRDTSSARDGSLPTEATLLARVEELANEHHVTLDGLTVTVDENARPSDAVGAATDMLAPLQVSVHYTGYTVGGGVRASQWMFSKHEPIDVTFALRRSVSAPNAPGMREPTPREMNGGE